MSLGPHIDRWLASAPQTVDLTEPAQDDWVCAVADELIALTASDERLLGLEDELREAPVLLRLALKLARSKKRTAELDLGLRVSIVFAVYKEHNRLRTRAEHPHGENLLVRKVSQVEWLLEGAPATNWQLLVVDDGCPEKSGEIAQRIVDEHGLDDRVNVLFLQRAIDTRHPVVQGLSSTDQSQKGGSIQYGMHVAAEGDASNHVVAFTDADLSTHLGQLGLLIDPIARSGFDAAIGSRREPNSVVIKGGARNARGKLFIYLWKRLIPRLSPIVDTQCGFKAFRADVAKAIVTDTVEKRFAFDIELLLSTELARSGAIARVPIAWIDSEAASTTKELQPYLRMLRSIVLISKRYLPTDPEAAGFASLIDSLDEDSWRHLSCNVPRAIAEREPSEFDAFDGVSARDLARIAHAQSE